MSSQFPTSEKEPEFGRDPVVAGPGVVTTKAQAKGGAMGAVGGAVVGAIIGAIIGAIAFGGASGIIISVIAFAVAGAVAGGVLGGYQKSRSDTLHEGGMRAPGGSTPDA
ncbi:MAG: hypothetical protein M3290_02215 [Actinomycetota bacterium]|nr:hypothetical protein [Actinomycetota bacterium]